MSLAMCSSSDLMSFAGTKLQHSKISVCRVLSAASTVTMATSSLITDDNAATPALLM